MEECYNYTVSEGGFYLGLDEYNKYRYIEKVQFFNIIDNIYNSFDTNKPVKKSNESLEDYNIRYDEYNEQKTLFILLMNKAYLELQLSKDNKELRYTVSDGNCLFDSIARSLNKLIKIDNTYLPLLKSELYKHFDRSNIDKILPNNNIIKLDQHIIRQMVADYYKNNKEEYQPYRGGEEYNISKNTIWGGEIELVIVSKIFNIRLNLYNSGGKQHKRDYNINNSTKKIDLAYVSPNHYQCIREIKEDISINDCYNFPLNLDFENLISLLIRICDDLNIPYNIIDDRTEKNYNTFSVPRPMSYPKKSNKYRDKKTRKKKKKRGSPKLDTNPVQIAFRDHIDMRFTELGYHLQLNSKVKVIIGGNGNTSFLAKENGTAESQFKNKKYLGDNNDYLAVKAYLDLKTRELKTAFPKRVTFGNVRYETANRNCINVWGANESNWNLPNGTDIKGSGMAKSMQKQKDGVYGIVTTPVKGLPSSDIPINRLNNIRSNSKKTKKVSAYKNNKKKYNKTELRDYIIGMIEKRPERIREYEDILGFINLDIFLGSLNLTLCEPETGINSIYYSFAVLLNKFMNKNKGYKEHIFDKILNTGYIEFVETLGIEDIKKLCFNNMIKNHIKLTVDLKDHIDKDKIKIKKYGKHYLKNNSAGGLITTVSLCDFFEIDIVIIYKTNKIVLFRYGNPIIIQDIANIEENKYNIILALEEFYYPAKHITDTSHDVKNLIDYQEIQKSLNL